MFFHFLVVLLLEIWVRPEMSSGLSTTPMNKIFSGYLEKEGEKFLEIGTYVRFDEKIYSIDYLQQSSASVIQENNDNDDN